MVFRVVVLVADCVAANDLIAMESSLGASNPDMKKMVKLLREDVSQMLSARPCMFSCFGVDRSR